MRHVMPVWLIRLVLMICLMAILSACANQNPSSDPSVPGISVEITAAICPSSAIKVGDQVTWTNRDDQDHVVHAQTANGRKLFDSGVLKPGDSFSFVFTQAETYAYSCTQDGAMLGNIKVEP